MKIKEILASAALILALTGTTAFAMPKDPPRNENDNAKQHNRYRQNHHADACKDPIKRLEAKKEKVERLLKEGKLTKEQANDILKRIDDRIAEVKEFQKLPLEQKKEKVLNDLRTQTNQFVKDGKMTQEEADKMMKKAKEKLENWDGKGFPRP